MWNALVSSGKHFPVYSGKRKKYMVSVVGFLHVFGDGERGEVPRTPLQICDMILDVKLKALIGISVRDKTEIPTNV